MHFATACCDIPRDRRAATSNERSLRYRAEYSDFKTVKHWTERWQSQSGYRIIPKWDKKRGMRDRLATG